MTLLTALLAGAAFVLIPFIAIGTIFLVGTAIQHACQAGETVYHRASRHHPV